MSYGHSGVPKEGLAALFPHWHFLQKPSRNRNCFGTRTDIEPGKCPFFYGKLAPLVLCCLTFCYLMASPPPLVGMKPSHGKHAEPLGDKPNAVILVNLPASFSGFENINICQFQSVVLVALRRTGWKPQKQGGNAQKCNN